MPFADNSQRDNIKNIFLQCCAGAALVIGADTGQVAKACVV